MPDARHWLAGRLVLVTGASRGIGAATAEALADAGARVVLAARNGEALEAVAEGIRGRGGDARAVPTDVARPEDIDALFADVAALRPAGRARVRGRGADLGAVRGDDRRAVGRRPSP